MEINPTPYTNSDSAEVNAVNMLRCLINPNKAKLDIKERDKFPNIDGYIELVKSSGIPDGKLEVQIKKLPKNFDPKNPKIKIETSLYAYSKKGTSNPVLHIGVDVNNNTAYWVYIHDNLLNTRKKPLKEYKGKTTIISLNLSNVDNGIIEYGKSDYVKYWKSFSQKHINFTNDYDKLKAKFKNDYDKLKAKFRNLELHSESTLGEYSDEFVYLHTFLDELNDKLGYFDIIKKRFYFDDTWKLGLVYKLLPNNGLSYDLFPIPFNKNDIQIKKVKLGKNDRSLDILDGFRELGIFKAKGHFGNNPMKTNPKGYARKIIGDKITKILEDRVLYLCNEFAANEVLFTALETSHTYKLMDNKNSFKIEEIKKIDSEKKLVNRIYPSFNEISFIEALDFLDLKGVKEVNRVYMPRDWEKNSHGVETGYYSINAMKRNIEIVFKNLIPVYNDIVSCNFSNLSKELSLFEGVSKLIVAYSLKERYDYARFEKPIVNVFYLKSNKNENFEFRFCDMNELPFTREDFYKKHWEYLRNKELRLKLRNKDLKINFEGKEYIPLDYDELSHIFNNGQDTPMLSLIYYYLESKIKRIINNW